MNASTDRNNYDTMSMDNLRALADSGDAEAQYRLGVIHGEGRGVPKDARAAFSRWSKAAQLDHALAQNNLGVLYERGEGTAKNPKLAFFWYRKSAARGNPLGQANLGRMYQKGTGTSRNLEEARSWYEKAAAQGVAEAESLLQCLPKELSWKKISLVLLIVLVSVPATIYGVGRFGVNALGLIAILLLFALGLVLRGKKRGADTSHDEQAARERSTQRQAWRKLRAQGKVFDMNTWARIHLEPIRLRQPFTPQFAYGEFLGSPQLDFSVESLGHVDSILDSIRTREQPQFGAFLEKPENQSFLLVLCFYVGEVIAKNSGQKINWFDYDGMLEAIPDNGRMFPRCFQTSATCILDKAGFFVPLSSICSRLFDDPVEKSVKFSAEGFMRR